MAHEIVGLVHAKPTEKTTTIKKTENDKHRHAESTQTVESTPAVEATTTTENTPPTDSTDTDLPTADQGIARSEDQYRQHWLEFACVTQQVHIVWQILCEGIEGLDLGAQDCT